MHRAFIFQASLVSAAVLLIFGVEGKQTRRAQDELRRDQAARAAAHERAGVEVVEVSSSEHDDASSARRAAPPDVEKGESALASPASSSG